MSNIPDDPIIFDDDEEVTPFRRILDLVMEQKEVIDHLHQRTKAATRRDTHYAESTRCAEAERMPISFPATKCFLTAAILTGRFF